MRRSLAGILLMVSGVLIALSLSTLWLQQVAFSPAVDAGTAKAVLGDEAIRSELATLIASADAPALEQSSAQLREYIEQSTKIDEGSALMSGIVKRAHARLIGERTKPVRVTPGEQVVIVRNERVALEPPITLPVQKINSLARTNTAIGWLWKVAGGLGLLVGIAGIVLRPEPGERSLALSIGLAGLGLLFPFFGWVVPFAILPALSDDTWMGIFPQLANDDLLVTVVVSTVSLVLALVIALVTTGSRQRRQFSRPLSVGRFGENRWSR